MNQREYLKLKVDEIRKQVKCVRNVLELLDQRLDTIEADIGDETVPVSSFLYPIFEYRSFILLIERVSEYKETLNCLNRVKQ